MMMKKLLAGALVACLAATATAKPIRVLVLPGRFDQREDWFNNQLHQFDRGLKRAGCQWTYATREDFKSGGVFNRLGEFDIITAPGSFYAMPKGATRPVDQDMTPYLPQVRKWLADGGIFTIQGVSDANAVFLSEVDPKLNLKVVNPGCYQQPFSPAPEAETFSTLPDQFWWPHHFCHLVIPEGTGWKPFLICKSGAPVALWQPYGKGGVFTTVLWNGDSAFFRNPRLHFPLLAQGVRFDSSDISEPVAGENRFSVTLTNLSDAPRRVTLACEKDAITETIPAKKAKKVTLKAMIAARGKKACEVTLSVGGVTVPVYDKEVRLRELFEVGTTRYRNFLAIGRRYENVRLATYVSPIKEDVKGAVVRLTAYAPNGKKISETKTPACAGKVDSFVKMPLDLPAGEYRIAGELVSRDGKTVLGKDETKLEILPPVPGQVAIDEDQNLIVDGEPFFPLGMYHCPSAEFPEMAELGPNMIQLFGYYLIQGLERAWENGLRTAWQPWGDGPPPNSVRRYADNPSLMMWYLLDEPGDEQVLQCKEETVPAFHGNDKHHPTFFCSCHNFRFPAFADTTDVFSIDPYPMTFHHPDIVARWMDEALTATKGDRPTLCVLQSHMNETHAEWLMMTYLSLCHRANGLLWYCWAQEGGGPRGTGVKNNAEHRKDLPRLAGELRALSPALLNTPERKSFVKDGIHGVALQDPETKTRYLILVNPATNGKEITPATNTIATTIKWQGVKASTKEAKGAFGYKGFPMKNGVLSVEMKPMEVRVLYADGPAPVAVMLPGAPQAPSGKGKVLKVGAKARYRTIQAAVDAAKPGDEIVVAPGVYKPFKTKNDYLTIRSAKGSASTFIDAKGEGRAATLTAKPYGNMFAETNTVLVGFTLRNGVADKTKLHRNFGGCALGGTLRDCVIKNGTAQYGGGAAYARLEKTTVEKCHATKTGGGATISVLKDCLVRNNAADYDGGGATHSASDGTTYEANRAGRDGGGVRYGYVTRCRFVKNEAGRDGGGAKLDGNDQSLLMSSLFDGNRAGRFGGGATEAWIYQCTFVNNSAAEGGAVYGGFDKRVNYVQQSILWGNTATKAGTEEFVGRPGTIRKCCVKQAGAVALPPGCIADDPKFVGKDDYRLKKDSPCIDFADGVGVPGEKDLAGKPRRLGRVTDAGAYECGGKPHAPWLDEKVELVRWTPGEDKTTSVSEDVKLPAGREATDLRLTCRFTCGNRDKRGTLVRFESKTGVKVEMWINPRDGLLNGKVVYPGFLDTLKPEGEPNSERTGKASNGVRVDDGKVHEATFTLHALGADTFHSELTLDGKIQPVAYPWWMQLREAMHLGDGTLTIEPGACGDLAEVVLELLPTPQEER